MVEIKNRDGTVIFHSATATTIDDAVREAISKGVALDDADLPDGYHKCGPLPIRGISETTRKMARASNGDFLPPNVQVTFTCAVCQSTGSTDVPWSEHHTLPDGWVARDVVMTCASLLPRRTNHAFVCSAACRAEFDRKYPLKPEIIWFDVI